MNHFYSSRKLGLLFLVFISFSYFASATTFPVTNTNPSGPGSLDQAIQDANANPGADVITFAIVGTPPFVITPIFPGLTTITEAVTINGYSQPGSSQGPILSRTILIVINGAAAGFVNGLTIDADNVQVSGLTIDGFGQSGINVLNGRDNLFIWGNFIGSDPTGLADAGNGINGINLGEFGPGGSDGVIIGTNSDGTADTDEGNLISGNGQDGILGWALSNSIISGNFIGSDRTGTGTTLGNTRNGILLTVGSGTNRIGTNGDNVNDAQELNGMILNGGSGISIAANSNDNVVAGNIVGINTAGAAAGNLTNGIEIVNSRGNRIGIDGTHVDFMAESNVVSSNAGNGISVTAMDFFGNVDPTTNNLVAGNYIGTTPTNTVRGNGGNGVSFSAADGVVNSDNIIGSNNDGVNDNAEGNIITNNGVIGIGTNNSLDIFGNIFSRNNIFNNSALGIDLAGNGITPNDDGDPDNGPNEFFNFPVITSSHGDGTNLTVTGIGTAGSIIEFFLDDGSGEGSRFLFRAMEGGTLGGITDNLTGTNTYSDGTYGNFTGENFQFTVVIGSLPINFPPGARLVAVGIDFSGANSTSEFGPSILILPVILTNFKAQLADGLVKLSWNTSREVNSSHFVIEKSIDGVTYSPIGQVKSGASTGAYSFTDNTPLGKINYYRLKMVDADGSFTYSKVLIVRSDAESLIVKLSPNPVSTYLNVSFKLERDEVVRVNVFDQMGRITRRYTLQGSRGINAFTISDLGSLPAGNYVVELRGDTVSAKQQLIKK